jgi:hypothetical protein
MASFKGGLHVADAGKGRDGSGRRTPALEDLAWRQCGCRAP